MKLLVDDFAGFLQHANFPPVFGEGVTTRLATFSFSEYSMTLELWMGASWVTICPDSPSCWGLTCLVRMLTPFHDYLALFRVNAEDFAHFAFIPPSNHLNRVALSDVNLMAGGFFEVLLAIREPPALKKQSW
jgi:hypothetical protein